MRTDIQDRARTSPSDGEIVDVDTTTDTITDDNKIIRSHNEEEANDTIATPLQDDIPDVDEKRIPKIGILPNLLTIMLIEVTRMLRVTENHKGLELNQR